MAARQQQLGFPWCMEDLRCVSVTELRGTSTVVLSIHEGHDEVALRLSLAATSRDDEFNANHRGYEIRLRTAHPAWCRINGDDVAWDMEPFEAVSDEVLLLGAEPFGTPICWAVEHLEEMPDELPQTYCEEGSRWLPALLRAASDVRRRALAQCDEAARDIACRLHRDARMVAYSALIARDGRRMEQMIDSCPGLIALAVGGDCASIVNGIRDGRRLPEMIRSALPEDANERVALQLVRRAPRRVRPATLRKVVTAAGIDINDLPTDEGELDDWYRVVETWRVLQGRIESAEERGRFGAFVSKHAGSIRENANGRWESHEVVLGEIVDAVVLGLLKTPSRQTDPRQVCEHVEEWHFSLWNEQAAEPERSLPRANLPPVILAGFSAEQIRTVGELAQEGVCMRHCVSSYVHDALAERIYIFRAVASGQRLTIALAPSRTGWRIVEAAAKANRPVIAEGLVRRWIRSLNAGGSPTDQASHEDPHVR
jgi:hypothetical protein